MGPTKVLQINPILFSTNKSTNSKTIRRDKKSKPINQYKGPNTLRKTLLGKIRDFQKKEEDGNKKEDLIESNEPSAFESEFNKSLQFLQELSKQKAKNKTQKERKQKSKSTNIVNPKNEIEIEIKTDAIDAIPIIPIVHTELPDVLKEPSFIPLMQQPIFQPIKIQPTPLIQLPMPMSQPLIQPIQPIQPPIPQTIIPTPMSMPIIQQPPTPVPIIPIQTQEPEIHIESVTKPPIFKDSLPYSNLKGGTKPTYKEWLRLTQKTKPTTNTNTTIQNVKIKDMISKKPKKMINVKTTTRTLKYNLGKHGRTVSVLIKNRNTRKKIKQEHTILKQKPINEVKDFLRQKNLIKAGTSAPNNVLREMYEQSILTGDVSNNSKDNLIHNFLTDTISNK
jgi:hypothetical protein